MTVSVDSTKKLGTRAVVRHVESGCAAVCSYCGEHIKFSAKKKPRKFVCNIYKGDVWDRLEQYHFECYEEAGRPYGVEGPLNPPRSFKKGFKNTKSF